MTELKQVKEALEDIVELASKGIDNPVLLTIENEASDALVELERHQQWRQALFENAVPGELLERLDENFADELVQRVVEGVTSAMKTQAETKIVLNVSSGKITLGGGAEDRLGAAVLEGLELTMADEEHPRKVTILIGIPGSGKSTWAARQEGATVVNADRYHIGADGVYRYSVANAGKAHLWCYRAFLDALERRDDHIIVDNTNTQNWERSPYVKHAQLCGYTVEFKRFRCPVELAAKRNVHGVSREIIEKMASRIEEPLSRWGEVEEIEEVG